MTALETMTSVRCNVCGASLPDPLFESVAGKSLTSLCEVASGPTIVRFCDACGHAQTDEMADVDAFYAEDYQILINSEDEDQLYAIKDGRRIFRLEHQTDIVLAKTHLATGARVLDYGAAKGASVRKLLEARRDIEVSLFDVSEMYVPFWERFADQEQWACFQVPPEWTNSFDLVTSFFVAEHVKDLTSMFRTIHRCLTVGGHVLFIVPNMFENVADFIVSDHVNHFSVHSLERLLQTNGFVDVDVDVQAYDSAFVVTARRGESSECVASQRHCDVADLRLAVSHAADSWQANDDAIRHFENTLAPGAKCAIYGAGFYGTYLYSRLKDASVVECFLDANPHLHSTSRFGIEVVSPDDIPADVTIVLVGLNPKNSRSIISNIDAFRSGKFELFFLDA